MKYIFPIPFITAWWLKGENAEESASAVGLSLIVMAIAWHVIAWHAFQGPGLKQRIEGGLYFGERVFCCLREGFSASCDRIEKRWGETRARQGEGNK